jgi:hypothetical protein
METSLDAGRRRGRHRRFDCHAAGVTWPTFVLVLHRRIGAGSGATG